jgi:energy-coupling factor transporter ATP-binding protein EcfA2
VTESPVIAVKGLRYRYPPSLPDREAEMVLRGVDLDVARGEFVALMGPTGVGKSTLCLALNGIVPQSTGGVFGGSVTVLGHDTRHTPVPQLARYVGIVYQDPESQLFSATVEAEVAFGPENLGLPRAEIAERVTWALDVVGMSASRGRSPARLSGGQKQRVAIAASLAMLPQILILDEPTAALDPLGRLEVFRVIEQLRNDQDMTIVMVSQDPEHVAAFADRLALLAEGRIVAEGPPAELFYALDQMAAVGVAAPQLAELSVALERQYGVGRRFMVLDEAETALREQWLCTQWDSRP